MYIQGILSSIVDHSKKVHWTFFSYAWQQKKHHCQMLFLSHRGREIRTPIDGFGDRCSAIELYPYILFSMYLENHIYYYTSKLLLRQYLTVNFLMEVLLRFAQKNDLPTRTQPSFGFASIVFVKSPGQTLDRLVLVSSMHYCTSTPSLSTSSSSRGLTSFKEWDISS